MIVKVEREATSNLKQGSQLPEFAKAGQPEEEESDTLWDRVIRTCDQYGLKPRKHCPA